MYSLIAPVGTRMPRRYVYPGTPLIPFPMKTPSHTDPETKKKEKSKEVDERSKPDGKKTTTQKK